ncbi:hypothetical protein WP2S18E08_43760 [Escherichia coli]|nr:hypothetical protein WP2S18E08_43760 [Escherichia coli]
MSPNIIVPTLADRGVYIASESTFYRVLNLANQLIRRTREHQYKRPEVLKAVAPNQVWNWDISYIPSWVKGQHFYLYMIVDIYSRKIIAAEVFTKESGQYAAELLQRAVWNEKCSSRNLVLHSDCQRQDYWPFFAIFNVRYWSLMLSAFRHFIITDWRGVFCQHSRFAFFL